MNPAIVRALAFTGLLAVSATLSSCCSHHSASATPNQLTAAEKRAGWKLLFDGQSLNGWHRYGKAEAPDHGWTVENGILNCVAGAKGGDIVTMEKFTDFDFRWDWRIPAKANNGIKYMVDENRPSAPGQEYQMVDESIGAAHPAERSTASFYDVLPPSVDKVVHPPGEWNHSRVFVKGNHVEHWLNGKKVLRYELGSPEVKAAVAKSKFNKTPHFGEKITGPILLTEHNDAASFRNVKILVLNAPVD